MINITNIENIKNEKSVGITRNICLKIAISRANGGNITLY